MNDEAEYRSPHAPRVLVPKLCLGMRGLEVLLRLTASEREAVIAGFGRSGVCDGSWRLNGSVGAARTAERPAPRGPSCCRRRRADLGPYPGARARPGVRPLVR